MANTDGPGALLPLVWPHILEPEDVSQDSDGWKKD